MEKWRLRRAVPVGPEEQRDHRGRRPVRGRELQRRVAACPLLHPLRVPQRSEICINTAVESNSLRSESIFCSVGVRREQDLHHRHGRPALHRPVRQLAAPVLPRAPRADLFSVRQTFRGLVLVRVSFVQ